MDPSRIANDRNRTQRPPLRVRPCVRPFLVIALVAIASSASAGGTELMFPSEGQPFTAPNRIFSVTVPTTWGAALIEGDPDTVQFRALSLPGHGQLQIRRLSVPEGASARQLMLNAVEQRLSKLPQFRMTARRDVAVAGYPAAAVNGTYDFHGNAQYPRVLEEIYVVAGNDAYIFHFECALTVAEQYARDLTMFYQSFQPRSATAESNTPFAVGDEPVVDDTELPF